MNITFTQGSTKRGIVRLLSCIGLIYASYKSDTAMIGAIAAAASAANGILGITTSESSESPELENNNGQ